MQKHSTEIADQLEFAGKYTHLFEKEGTSDYYHQPLSLLIVRSINFSISSAVGIQSRRA